MSTSGERIQLYGANGQPLFGSGVQAADALALPVAPQVVTVPTLYDGNVSNLQRGNQQGTLLASAVRAATTRAAQQINYNARGVVVILSITVASGTGGLQTRFLFYDPISGNVTFINAAPTALVATGTFAYALYPGASAALSQAITNAPLARLWTCEVQHGDASNYTYSLSYQLIL